MQGNPMLDQINSQRSNNQPQLNPQVIQNVKNMMNQIKLAQNPQMMLNQMMMNNPQFASVINLINQGGGNPETVFYNLAKQKGVDPNCILNQLR